MARIEIQKDVCDRCPPGREKDAPNERIFSLDGVYNELKLCDPHAEMFDREWHGWSRLAKEIDPPTNGRTKSEFFNAERRRESLRIAELRDKAQKQAASREFAERRAAEIEVEEALAAEHRARQSIPGAMKWRMTNHARERMVERGFTISQVLETAAQPEHTYRQDWRGPHLAIYQRGDCRIAVDDVTKAVITVIDRTDTLETAPPNNGAYPQKEKASL